MYVAGGRGGPSGRGGGRGGFGRGFGDEDGRIQTCYKCGGPNHFARDCHAKSVKCYACGKFEGHIVPYPPLSHVSNSSLQSRECPYANQNAQTDNSGAASLPPSQVEQ